MDSNTTEQYKVEIVEEKKECVNITIDTHDRIYKYLLDELNVYKQLLVEKDEMIEKLNKENTELELKIKKINNLELLIKIKENLVNKQNELEIEMNENKKPLVVINEDVFNEVSTNTEDDVNKQNLMLKPKKKPIRNIRHF
jgi:CRISPR/Cas system CMR subunit Cmr4 (Cas7 group RAMP superfamily)